MTILSKGLRALDRLTRSGSTRWLISEAMRKRGYGHILKLTIDPKAGSLDTEVLLKGEAEPLSLHLDYRVGTGGKPSLTILSLRCSRPWMEALARDFLLKKEIPLPGRAAALLRDLLG